LCYNLRVTAPGPVSGMSRLAPLEVQSTPAVVAARIRAGIFAGRFSPDTQLNEVELARELQVSRGPIREAFARLSHEGLLRRERNRGVFVVALDAASICDVFYLREVIERAAAHRVAERQDRRALAQLAATLDDLAAALDGEWSELVEVDLEFHRCLVRSSGSERLVRAFEPLYAETRLCLAALATHYADRATLLEEHRAILDAISASDRTLIDRLVHAHMTDSADTLTALQEGR
jgi:DNA-binding GntR family transcriptional regulator